VARGGVRGRRAELFSGRGGGGSHSAPPPPPPFLHPCYPTACPGDVR